MAVTHGVMGGAPPPRPPGGGAAAGSSSSSTLFDIKVALVGPISSGKTTVLNALLGDDYGLVFNNSNPTMERTSNEIVYYRLVSTSGRHVNVVDPTASFDASTSYYPRSNIESVVLAPEVRLAEQQRIAAIQQSALVQQQATTTTTQPNSRGGGGNSTVPEQYVTVNLRNNLFEMRPDTQLVLVDIPGFDLQQQKCPYASYLERNWDTFDCILIVLDVNTSRPQDQENCLKFIQQNLQEQTRHPCLILWNKLDDPYDPKGLQLIQQTQSLIGLVLNQQNQNSSSNNSNKPKSSRSLTTSQSDGGGGTPFVLPEFMGDSNAFGPPMTNAEILKKKKRQQEATAVSNGGYNSNNETPIFNAFPPTTSNNPTTTTTTLANPPPTMDPLLLQPPLLFLPLSAKEALVYKRVSNMTTLDDFAAQMFEQDWMVERLSRDQIGLRKWNQLTRSQQLEESFALLQDPREYKRALQECGYTKFHDALADLVGNRQGAQTLILETRMELSLRALLGGQQPQAATSLLAPQLYSVVTKFQVLYGSTEAANHLPHQLQTAFWAAYDKLEVNALKQLVEYGPTQINALAQPLEQLLSYQTVSKLLQWHHNQNHNQNQLQQQTQPIQPTDVAKKEVNTSKRMRKIVVQFFQLLFEQESLYDYDGWGGNFQARCCAKKRGTKQQQQQKQPHDNNPWMKLSPKDWIHIWSSLLLLGYDRHFCQHYVREKLLMEELLDKAKTSWKSYQNLPIRICPHCAQSLVAYKNEWRCYDCKFAFHTCWPTTTCNGCKVYRFDEYNTELHNCEGNGYTYSTQQSLHVWMRTFYDRSQKLVPTYPNLYNTVSILGDIPESLANPKHIGHVLYQSCHLNELLLLEGS